MLTDRTETTPLLLPSLAAVIGGLALVFPALRLPLALVCLAALGNLAMSREGTGNLVPETPPVRQRRSRARRSETSTEDSFPASDPPSWTPVTGTGTQH